MRLIFLILFFFTGWVHARPLMLIPTPSDPHFGLGVGWRSDLWTMPDHNKDSPIRIYDLRLSVPFLERNERPDGTGSNQNLFFIGDTEGFSTGKANLVVGRNRILIGSDLRSQSAGFGFTKRFEDASWYSVTASYTSDSDEPYQQWRSTWIESSASYAFTRNDDWQWLVMLSYSKNRGYLNNQMIPMVGGYYYLSRQVTLTLGLPFFKLAFQDPLWQDEFVLTPTGTGAELIRSLSPSFDAKLRLAYTSRSYLHQNRIQDDARLFYEEKLVETGFRCRLSDITNLEFLIGRSINRNLYEAKQVFLPMGIRTNLPDDIYGRLFFEVQL